METIAKTIDNAQLFGHWILIENITLESGALTHLNALYDKITNNSSEIDDSFRLFILTSADDGLPIEILHASVKFAYETNMNLNKSTLETLKSDEIQQLIERNLTKPQIIQNVLYFCALNSTIHERCAYRHYGWNLSYDFIESDLLCGLFNLEQMTPCLNSVEETWNELAWIVANFAWGARILDQQDYGRLSILSNQFFLFFLEHCGSSTFNAFNDVLSSIPHLDNFQQMQSDQKFEFRKHENQNFINAIKCIEHRKLIDENTSNEDNLLQDIIAQILLKLPDSVLNYTHYGSPQLKDLFCREVDGLNEIKNVIKCTLEKLSKYLDGKDVYLTASEDIQHCLLKGAVPISWYIDGFRKTKSLGKWVENVQQRIQYFAHWQEKRMLLPIWLGAFSSPRAFLVAVKQNYAQKCQLSLIDIDFQFNVIGHSDEKVLFL